MMRKKFANFYSSIRDEDSLLLLINNKSCELKKLIDRMLSYASILRPNCDEILKESHVWTLSLEELESYSRIKHELEQILNQKISDESIIEHFFEFHIQQIYCLYKRNKENKEN